MRCLVFCSCVNLLRMVVFRFIHLCKGHELIIFYGCIVFHGVYVPHFPCPGYHWWALRLIPRLCYRKQCPQWIYVCMCLYNRMICNPLGIYPVMRLLGQIEFLFLCPWGSATLSSTMVDLIDTPTNSVKAFLFLHILSSICCLQKKLYFEIISNLKKSYKNNTKNYHILFTHIHELLTFCHICLYSFSLCMWSCVYTHFSPRAIWEYVADLVLLY